MQKFCEMRCDLNLKHEEKGAFNNLKTLINEL